MPVLRVSAISFLNTAPLMWDFERGDAGKDFEISYTIPSECAAALAAGTADMGIIPAVTYAHIPGLVILPNIAIAARDNVRSILLISKKPIEGKATPGDPVLFPRTDPQQPPMPRHDPGGSPEWTASNQQRR